MDNTLAGCMDVHGCGGMGPRHRAFGYKKIGHIIFFFIALIHERALNVSETLEESWLLSEHGENQPPPPSQKKQKQKIVTVKKTVNINILL